jgi:hypothetical protein
MRSIVVEITMTDGRAFYCWAKFPQPFLKAKAGEGSSAKPVSNLGSGERWI